MGVDCDLYVFVGIKTEYLEDDDDQIYEMARKHPGIVAVTDGMSGAYSLFGVIIASANMSECDSIFSSISSTDLATAENAAYQKLIDIGLRDIVQFERDDVKLHVISHYS